VKLGDIVNFHTNAWVFEHAKARYANPGVIVEVNDEHRQTSYCVLWADGRMSNEHRSYLKLEEEEKGRSDEDPIFARA
jgi:hypothetical protein